jgi:surfactin synthase thioesterase subunit
VRVPICAIRGTTDSMVGPEQAGEWRRATTADFVVAEIPGGHMYLVDRAREVLDLIEAQSAGDR